MKNTIGNLSTEVLEAVLETLPVEISLVDGDDIVCYFKNGDSIFPRPRNVIGRRVQDCHPKKSLHVVTRLFNEMKENKRDIAEFWINLKDRKIFIRYFAVRAENGKYLGCLEATQDVTDLKKIEGESRLLDLK